MTAAKTLVIGSTGHTHVTCVAWENLDSVNLKDFDIIVANIRSLSDRFLKSCPQGFFDKTRSTLSSWLATGGELIVLGEKTRRVEVSPHVSFTNYSWLPIDIGTSSEEGSTIAVAAPQYKKLIDRFAASSEWQFYYFIPQPCLSSELKQIYGPIPETEYKIALLSIAENRSQEVLSGTIEISVKPKDGEELKLNPIALLPYVDGLEEREAINLVLEDKLSLPQETLPPAWVEVVPMPLVNDIQQSIDEKKKAIAAIEQEIAENQEEKRKLETFKKLIYANGQELEALFATCLELLGGKIAPASQSGNKVILVYKKQLYFVACVGTKKSLTLTPVRQLMADMLTFEEEEGYTAKGILLGNAWNTMPPEYRGQDDTVIFPDNVVKKAEALDIGLLSSVAFFDAFCEFLAGTTTGEAILDNIVRGAGIVEFEPAQKLTDTAIV